MSQSRDVAPDRINDQKRAERAMQLRLAGATFEQIADQLGYSDKANAARAVANQVRKIGKDEAKELFDLNIARTEKLLMAVWPAAMRGELYAVDRVLAILKQQSSMCGHNAATVLHTSASADEDSPVDTGPASLAAVLGTDSAELEQRMARVLNEALPASTGSDE